MNWVLTHTMHKRWILFDKPNREHDPETRGTTMCCTTKVGQALSLTLSRFFPTGDQYESVPASHFCSANRYSWGWRVKFELFLDFCVWFRPYYSLLPTPASVRPFHQLKMEPRTSRCWTQRAVYLTTIHHYVTYIYALAFISLQKSSVLFIAVL